MSLDQRFQAMEIKRIKVPNQGKTNHCGVYVCYFIRTITELLGSKQDATLEDIITLMDGSTNHETLQKVKQFRQEVWEYRKGQTNPI